MVKNILKFKYSILTSLIGIGFIMYMFNTIENSAGGVENFTPLQALIDFILHIPFLLALLISTLLYIFKKNIIASIVLGSLSFIYLCLHQFVFSYSYYYNSYYYIHSSNIRVISFFPLLGLFLSIYSVIIYRTSKKQNIQ